MTKRRMRITGNDVPDDVWRIVANHILQSGPRHDLYRLISVNRTFFNVVLDMRYREVRWTKMDGHMVRLLDRLQEPIIANHVRKLFIQTWFVELLFKREMSSNKGMPKTKTLSGGLIRSLSSYFKKKFSAQRRDKYGRGRTYANPTDALSSTEIIRLMIKAVNGMINVTEFNFEWRDLPLNKDAQIFLTSTRTTFDTSLRKLALRAQVCKFKELLAITNFDNVHELDFHFDYHPNMNTTASKGEFTVTTDTNTQPPRIKRSDRQAIEFDIQDLLEIVVPFINHRRTLLNSLTISSSSTMDLSKFFKALRPMPALRRFRAWIYFDNSCLRDVSGILRILNSMTLHHVELRPNLPDRANYDWDQKLLEKQLDWLRLNELLLTSPSVLRGLESLEIPYVSPSKTVPLLCRSCDTLTNLCLTGRFLTKDEVTEVIGIFSHRPFEMQHFHIQVENMEAPLIYMLADGLPGLFSLVLVYHRPLLDVHNFDPPNKVVEATLLDWKLRCLSVYVARYMAAPTDVPPLEELEIMGRICALVPSVNYYGHSNYRTNFRYLQSNTR